MAKDLRVYTVTFNCGRELIEPDIFGHHLFDGWRDDGRCPDLIVLNLQEIAPIGRAFTNSILVRSYFDHFRKAVQVATKRHSKQDSSDAAKYLNVIARNAGLTAIMIFVRDDLADELSRISLAEVGVGWSQMGNKGAVGVRMYWKMSDSDAPLVTTFVSAHLAPFEAQISRRNQDYRDIVSGLVFSDTDAREWRASQSSDEDVPLLKDDTTSASADANSSSEHNIYSSDSHLIFSGDLNYRTAISEPAESDPSLFPQPTSSTSSPSHFSHLLAKDQLTREQSEGRTLQGLHEQPITFPPTYKYHLPTAPVVLDEGLQRWDWASHRWPSWCDRVLYSQSTDETARIKASNYVALPLFRTSDHRPVALSLLIPLRAVQDRDFESRAPSRINRQWQTQRDMARRKEAVVGAGAYLSLTLEGRMIVATLLVAILAGTWFGGGFG